MCKQNSWRRYVKCKSMWNAFSNISVILANVLLRSLRFQNLWIKFCLKTCSTILKIGWLFLFFPSRRLSVTFDIQIDFKNKRALTFKTNSEVYSEPCQTSRMELFAKIVNGFSFLTIFTKISIINVWQDSEVASETSSNLQKKLHLRCLAGFGTHFCINFRRTIAYLFTKFD